MKEKLIQLFINFLPKSKIHNLRYSERPEHFSITFIYEEEGVINSFEIHIENNEDARKQFITFYYPYVDVWGQKNITQLKNQEINPKEYDNLRNLFLEHYQSQINNFIPKI